MKRIFLGILFLLFGFTNFLNAQELTLDEVKKKASTVIKEFESKLKKELKMQKEKVVLKQ
ncbi:hypothetical protein [Halarcobacter anaerophilus]|uniref:hypothetical protein n=1 Tax=Halarcobacter anaerophilus TaxID=877500 RepID=UPI0005C925C5|nr:hypothetical protein [Halarcobacter anaerophilus]